MTTEPFFAPAIPTPAVAAGCVEGVAVRAGTSPEDAQGGGVL